MAKIQKIHIKRYRSVIDIQFDINTANNFITICGENNTGKTNTLRAIDLFFNPSKYEPSKDAPSHKYEGSRGGAVFPEISLEFLLNIDDIYKITRKFNKDGLELTKGEKFKLGSRRGTHVELADREIESFFKDSYLFFIESINISFPKLINELIDDLYDIEYGETRFRGLKSDLKQSFDNYSQGLLDILKSLSDEINPKFQEYKENWGIGFDLQTDVKKFRDLITDDINFYIKDSSNKNIEGKGSGLQRLAYILVHTRIIEKIKSNKSVFLLIDEPDVYLHQGIQKKLLNQLRQLTPISQVIITTHSPVFIDSYTLENVFLLDLEITATQYIRSRSNKTFNVLNTKIVDIDQVDGAKKIRDYLGIEALEHEILDRYNILVEGETDKYYIEELTNFFQLTTPNIIAVNGADNVYQYLNFYNSYHSGREMKPCILILLDNDNKGREVYTKLSSDLKKNKFLYLDLHLNFVPNFLGDTPETSNLASGKVHTDHQIEDFLYPALFCELVNRLLKRKGLNSINSQNLRQKITQRAFKDRGILALAENMKNESNPDDGQIINFTGSGGASESFKKGLAGFLKIQGDRKLVRIIQEQSQTYPAVEDFLKQIVEPRNYITS